jgi:endonuclease/exonuclease/phosphatase family metal-dependent hydrolase
MLEKPKIPIIKKKSYLIIIIAVPIVLFGLFLLFCTINRFNPDPVVTIATLTPMMIKKSDTLRLFDWNIGYCGLGDDMDFFYDGGSQMRISHQRTLENLDAVIKEIKAENTCQFFLLQEVDIKSKRSYKINQMEALLNQMPGYKGFLAVNYNSRFVPVPIFNPMGKIYSGLVTLSNYTPVKVDRINFGAEAGWPKSLFMMQRCFMVLRFPTSDGKQVVLINTHKSAYDSGEQRRKQMAIFKEFIESEYSQGNYIIAGGDWNQNPPIAGGKTEDYKQGHLTRIRIDEDYMPIDWVWVYDNKTHSNRMINEKYSPSTTVTTIIDFYLLSPNIEILDIKTMDLQFKNSDHQPVIISCRLK